MDRLKADFIASLPYAAKPAARVILSYYFKLERFWSLARRVDVKMLAHPAAERSARDAAPSGRNELRRNFLKAVLFETFLRPAALQCGISHCSAT
jgi:hypothetical protein